MLNFILSGDAIHPAFYKKASPSLSSSNHQLNLILSEPISNQKVNKMPKCLVVCDSSTKTLQPKESAKSASAEPEQPAYHQPSGESPASDACSVSNTSQTTSVLAVAGTTRASTVFKSATSVFRSVGSELWTIIGTSAND